MPTATEFTLMVPRYYAISTDVARTQLNADGGRFACMPDLLAETAGAAVASWLQAWNREPPLLVVTVLDLEATPDVTPIGAVYHRVVRLGRVTWGDPLFIEWSFG
jgi:hypothetical protein